jgi:AcrR family transcriptional regulator
VSKGGVYVHFQSKEEIFCAIARDASAGRHRIRTKQGPGGSASKKLQQYLLKSLGAYLEADNFKRIRFSMEFWLKAGLSSEHARPELKELNEQRFSLAGQDVRSLIEEGIASGEFRSGLSPHSLVYIVLAAIDGMAFFTAVMNQPLTAAIVQDFSELIIRSIKNPEA